MNKGTIKLYISDKLFDVRDFNGKKERASIMDKMHKIYALKTKEHYWDIYVPESYNISHGTREERRLIRKLEQYTGSFPTGLVNAE